MRDRIFSPKLSRLIRGTSAGKLIVTFGVALLILIWAGLAIELKIERERQIEQVMAMNSNLARAFEEHVIRTVEDADQSVLFLKNQYERYGVKFNLRQYVQDGMIGTHPFNILAIADEHGKLTIADRPFKPLDLKDREHFRVHVARDTGQLYISKPLIGRTTGKYSIFLSRRINKPDGSFGGVAAVAIDPSYFSDFYRQVDLGPGGVVTLVGRDGVVRARQADQFSAVGQDVSNSVVFTRLIGSSDHGSRINEGNVDGLVRIISWRALPDYPLIVVVGTAEATAMAPLNARKLIYFQVAAGITFFVLCFSGLVLFQFSRHGKMTLRLQKSDSRIRVLNRLYMTVSATNAAIVRSAQRQELCRRVCQIAAKEGEWAAAWIGFVDAATKRIVPEAWTDSMVPYIDRMVVSVDPSVPAGQGPTGIAARTGAPYFCNDVFADPVTLPWRQFMKSFGVASAAAVPLRSGRDFAGVINLYSAEKDFYTPDVQALLVELGDDISFALEAFENKQRRHSVENTLAAIVESSEDAITAADSNCIVTSWNAGAQRLYGYTAEEIIGNSALVLVPLEKREEFEVLTRNVMDGKPVSSLETVRVKKGGHYIDVSLTLSPIKDIDGRVTGYSVIGRDIGERKRVEDGLRKLSRAVEQSPASIVITDSAGNIEYVNPRFEAVSGYSMAEVIGRNPRIFRSGQTPLAEYEELWKTITAGGEWRGELCNRRKSGELFWEFASISGLVDEAGKIVHFVAVKEDITERKRMEREIRALNEDLERRVARRTAELERANRELDAFSYSISHDLRAPLRAINGFASILGGGRIAERGLDSRELLGRIVRNAKRMGEMVDDLLNFSRAGRGGLNLKRVDIGALVAEVVANRRANYPGTTVDVAPLPSVICDRSFLLQVFENLIGNAFKFSANVAAPKVVIGAQTAEAGTVFFVRDNGAGFDMGHAEKLFNVFQRLHNETEFPGTGVGLAIVKRIVERHGGRVWAESKPDAGATFYFTLGGVL